MRLPALIAFGLLAVAGPVTPAEELKPRANLTKSKDIVVDSLAFSADGKTLAAAVRDVSLARLALSLLSISSSVPAGYQEGTVKLWDVATGAERSFPARGGWGNCVAFSPDGNTLAAAGRDVRLWDLGGGKPRGRVLFEGRHDTRFSAVAFSPDGKSLAAADGVVRLWDVASGEERATFEGKGLYSVTFSPDGKTLASRAILLGDKNFEDEVKLWDVATAKEMASLVKEPFGMSPVTFSPDGKTLAFGGAVFDWKERKVLSGAIKLWDVAANKERATLKGHVQAVLSVAFTGDGKTLASGSSDGTVVLWDVATGKAVATLKGHKFLGFALAFSPDGKTLASGSEEVKLWDVAKILARGPNR
jgi:WD40 repeat protein